MDIIKNNPYRRIGILVGTSTKEEHTKTKKLKMYIEAGQEVPEDFSFPIIGSLNRKSNNVEDAISKLNLNNDRVNASLFWFYNGNATSTRYTVSNQLFGAGVNVLYLDKVKVGNSAQRTAALGATYELVKRVKIDANYLYATNLYADFNPTTLTSASNRASLKLPSYGLVDAGLSYKMLVGQNRDDSVLFRLNVNNVFDKIYISESKTDILKSQADFATPASYQIYKETQLYNGVDKSNNVNFGFGRTWNFSLCYNF